VELAKGTNVGIYPTLWPIPSWLNKEPDKSSIEKDDTERLLRYKNEFCRIALQIYGDGADGISTFNWTPHMEPGLFRNPGRRSWGMGAKSVQMELCRRLGSPDLITKYMEAPEPLAD